jgi:broad specificity phosphatase PhoE
MKNRIILARHGQDEDNAAGILNGRRDMPLTEKGVSQAHELVENIKKSNLNIGLVLSSALQRASRTAEICAEELGVSHVVLDYLIERNHGILEGHPYSDIPILAKEYKIAYGFTYVVEVEGGENYCELCRRALEVLSKLREFISNLNIEGDVLVVSHGAISRAMTLVHQGKTHKDIFDSPSFTNCEIRILE